MGIVSQIENLVVGRYKMTTMNIFSVQDKKLQDILYVLLNSLKQSKEDDTVINYYLIIEDVDQKFIDYFVDLESDTFHVYFKNASDYKSKINPPANSYLYYVRCLAPSIFPTLDKILYLDTDIICANTGIEELWNIDLTDKYLAAAIDIEQSLRDEAERINVGKNTQNNNYFNSGVMLMNLKKWRDEGYDKIIESYLYYWPKTLQCILFDQTLLNYVFKEGVKIISSKWNNSIFAMTKMDEVHYWRYYGTQDILKKLENVVLLHFKGAFKPWIGTLSPWQEWQLPHRPLGKAVYFQLYHELDKPEEF